MNQSMRPYIPTLSMTMKVLIGLNFAIWLVMQVILEAYVGIPFSKYFAMYPGKVLLDGYVWQVATYMWLHSLNVTHIVFNLLMLWFMGAELEQRWGQKFFLIYYLCSGIGAGIIYCTIVGIYSSLTGSQTGLIIPVVGSSGAVFGLLLAYGILFGERVIHFMMLFPMKAKYFVMILGGVEAVSILSNGVAGGDVANLAHLGGLASGYLTMTGYSLLQRYQWNRKAKKRGRNLRLIVNNEPGKDDPKQGPRYWN